MPSWNHRYDGPITVNPLFRWPLRPLAVLQWYVGAWFPVSISLGIVGLAFLSLWVAAPTLDQAATPGWWMLQILLRNLVIVTALAGGLHWYFHSARIQGDALKYDPRPFPRAGRIFTWDDQLKDNMTWTLASGVPIWTGFEVLIWMAMANGYAPVIAFQQAPIWFIAIFFLIPIWESFYFYWIHRLLHSNWLYPVHALHHRNTDIGPWSGLSMHPAEHVLYFGTALIPLVVPTHPVHLICHLMFYALYAATTHTGYEWLLARGAHRPHPGNFPPPTNHPHLDVDAGTDEGHAQMKARLATRRR